LESKKITFIFPAGFPNQEMAFAPLELLVYNFSCLNIGLRPMLLLAPLRGVWITFGLKSWKKCHPARCMLW